MNYNYSIVIPHKNTPDLLSYCLSTIPIRDDVQVIVVDDDSDPQKVDFEHFPQWGGKNYEFYLTKEGKGGGYARNVGMDHANGKWILFVDADDFLLPIINDIFDEEVNTDADIIYFRTMSVMLNDYSMISKRTNGRNALIDSYKETGSECGLRCYFTPPWGKFIKRNLIEKHRIRFEEIKYSNDVVFSTLVGCKAKSIVARDKIYYVLTESNSGLTSFYLSKPGELKIRSDAYLRAQEIIYFHKYAINEELMQVYANKFYANSKSDFWTFWGKMKKFGYSRFGLTTAMFKNCRWKSRLKRSLYVYFMSFFQG